MDRSLFTHTQEPKIKYLHIGIKSHKNPEKNGILFYNIDTEKVF